MTQKNKKSLTAPVSSNPEIACPKTYEIGSLAERPFNWLNSNNIKRRGIVFGQSAMSRGGGARVNNFRLRRNPSRVDAKRGDHFLQEDLSGLIQGDDGVICGDSGFIPRFREDS